MQGLGTFNLPPSPPIDDLLRSCYATSKMDVSLTSTTYSIFGLRDVCPSNVLGFKLSSRLDMA